MKTIQLIKNETLTEEFNDFIYDAIDCQSGYEYAWPWYLDRVEEQYYLTYMDKPTLEVQTVPVKVLLENMESL